VTSVDELPPAPGYSQAVVTIGQLAFVAGQVAFDHDGGLVGAGDLEAQVRQTLANLGRVMVSLGAEWRHVARLNWYVLDARQVQLIRAVRDEVSAPCSATRHRRRAPSSRWRLSSDRTFSSRSKPSWYSPERDRPTTSSSEGTIRYCR